jgi:PBP1b-binding outer membrane lipoprotein LpoB
MKTFNFTNKSCFVVLISLMMALSMAGCSNDNEKATNAKVVNNPFDHSHDVKVTDLQKHKFEHAFAEQCVQRELKGSDNKQVDKDRYSTPCMCIAKFLMKNLTAEEAEKFTDEHKNAQSLVIKYENAAYHCLQQDTHPKGPDFTRAAPIN